MDRPDIQYSTKEVCRAMSKPARGDWRKLKRIVRYLIGHPRLVSKFEWQLPQQLIWGFSESDWAGCRRTGKSTSGSAIMAGKHCLKTWSSTQKVIALSSGEAELIGIVKMSTEVLGVSNLMLEWGRSPGACIYADSSAALGVVNRKGAGKLRHIRIAMLWIPDKRASGEIDYSKVEGSRNPGDLMAKNLGQSLLCIQQLSGLNRGLCGPPAQAQPESGCGQTPD